MSDIQKSFKSRLIDELNFQGISNKEFAQKVGISVSTLSMYLYRGSIPAADVAVKMANYSTMQSDSIKKWIKTMSVSLLIVSVFLVIMEIVSQLILIRLIGTHDLRVITLQIVSGVIAPASIMAYITMALSVMGIVFATGKHRQFAQNQKAGSLVKVGVVIAILLAVIALAEVVLKAGVLYMFNP